MVSRADSSSASRALSASQVAPLLAASVPFVVLFGLPGCEENLDPSTPEGALHLLRDAVLQKDADAMLARTSQATHTRLADGTRGSLFDNEGYFLWDVDHAFRNSLQVGVDMRF